MWRRVLYFVVLLGGGMAVLSLLVGPENLFDLRPVENDPVGVRPAGEVRLDQKGKVEQRGRGTPQTVGIQIEGGIEDLRREYQVTLPSGKKRVLLLYQLRSDDVEPSNVDRSYVLRGVRIWFYRRVGRGEELRSVPVLRLDARQMTAFLDAAGGALRIDESQELVARDIEIFASPSGLAGDGEVPERLDPADVRLRVEAPRLFARLGEERIDLRSELEDGRMSIEVESRDRPLRISGRGFVADLPVDFEEGAARGEETAPAGRALPSRMILERDVEVHGLGARSAQGALPWRARGHGPLQLEEFAQGGLLLRLENEVELRGYAPRHGGAADPVELTGERLSAWLGRGRLPGPPELRRLIPPELCEIVVEGQRRAASLRHETASLHARRIELALDPFGAPERLRASGGPELVLPVELAGSGAERLRVRCAEAIVWRRAQGPMRWMLEPLGFGVLAPVLQLAQAPMPEDVLLFEGRTEIVPERALLAQGPESFGGLELLRCERGVIGFAQRSLGRFELTELHGYGTMHGRLRGRPEPLLFEGSDGFSMRRTPLSGRMDFVLGRPEPGRFAALVLAGLGYDLTGRGRLHGHVRLAPNAGEEAVALEGGELHFAAAPGSTLDAMRASFERPFLVEGVQETHLRFAGAELVEQAYEGQALTLRGADLLAIADRLERQGDGPWLLRREAQRVELVHTAATRGARLVARHLAIQPVPRPWPLPRGVTAYVLAEGDVEVRWQSPDLGRSFELDAASVRLWPTRWPLLHVPLRRALLGAGSASWHEAAFGSELETDFGRASGFYLAKGDVRLAMSERRPGGGVARQELRGDEARVLAGGRATQLLPAAGGFVRGWFDEPGALRCVVLAESLVTQGASFELGGARPRIWLDDGTDAEAGRLRIEPSGRIRFSGSELHLPGPVRLASAEGEELELLSEGDVRILFDPEALARRAEGQDSALAPRPVAAGLFGLPAEILAVEAGGGVELRRGELRGRCERIALDARTGWAQLHGGAGQSVQVRWGQRLLVDAWPGVELQLETLEMRGGSGRLFRGALEPITRGGSR